MTLVIDSSVIVKWFVQEEGHAEALGLLETTERICCPDFALVEAANVLWRKVRLSEIGPAQASEAVGQLAGFFDAVVPSFELLEAAFELAGRLQHSVYDCMFLACALRSEDDVLVSADERFLTKASENGFAMAVRPLSGQPPALNV
ncbi:type II toxin-antitoxin system VapC family toxin [Martelella soudanensis]|uniref:type II toxin-antitoxin system VapC family toxin n=1 Tax=unclassified Martelella TaxID=2629616 RepID=UPI0015DE2BD1|nr:MULTISPECIES: type II toxin-antitoxin system VapC family toxin [unclassified Martelella]